MFSEEFVDRNNIDRFIKAHSYGIIRFGYNALLFFRIYKLEEEVDFLTERFNLRWYTSFSVVEVGESDKVSVFDTDCKYQSVFYSAVDHDTADKIWQWILETHSDLNAIGVP